MEYDVVIVGSGAAGLSAALYAGRYKLKTLVIEGKFGGETATAGVIWNYPGVKNVDGYDLMKTMKQQAKDVGVEFMDGLVEKITRADKNFIVSTKKKEVLAKSVILAIGAKRRHLNLPNEAELTGKGVHYCVTCDGPLFGGKTIAMVGGGDSSVKGINFLADYAAKIYFIVRDNKITAEPINREQMDKLGDRVEILFETAIKEIVGKDMLEKVLLSRPYKGSEELMLDGLFIEIGFDPDKTFANQLDLRLNPQGYMEVDNLMQTNVSGIFAAGDATLLFGGFKQDITAAALGAVAATSAYEYIKKIAS
ncbi:MAG: FAD-dependent oxidoreductase [Candidatus Wildermuthbacteria bacterium]|nr:FAD-dependent oxidoreductase [Candidatus Wildermuthbacteria bacterium]